MTWEQRLDQLWASAEHLADGDLRARMEVLLSELPAGSAICAYERASVFDSTGHSDLAVPLYRQALHQGLADDRRRQAVIQLASSLRNIGAAEESVTLLRAEQARGSDDLDDALSGFLALALADAGQPQAALAEALLALSGHLKRYRRSLSNYAQEIGRRTSD